MKKYASILILMGQKRKQNYNNEKLDGEIIIVYQNAFVGALAFS
jgi:hypothetical protein